MIQCRFCQAIFVDNTVFCSECGNYLPEDETRDTDSLDTSEIGWVGDTTDHPRTGTSLQQDIKLLAIRLKIGAGKREVQAPLDKVSYIIGRVDPASNIFPEIDLSQDGSQAKSVSRRHARILKQGDVVFVEDLGGINGTFVNGKKLDPYIPETLNDGDILQLGKLPIEVKIQYQ